MEICTPSVERRKFVFTGDPNAAPGGRPNPITNPAGLVSQWCSAAFVAKYFIAFD